MRDTWGHTLISIVLILCGMAALLGAEGWPQWRGPSMNGVSSETNLPLRWSKSENIAWKLAVPWSGSTPIVWGDRIFLSVADRNELFLWLVDRARGVVVWKRRLGDGNTKMRKQNMASPSPVTDGRRLFVGSSGTGAPYEDTKK